jgi:diadenosine tetraphosphate (Ap4A) HIT family hydrolase
VSDTPAGDCLACQANSGVVHPPGGVIYDDGLWRLEHMLAPAVLPGWLILKPLRHVESLTGLTPAEAAALGPLLVRATAALEAVTSAERVYSVLLAEAVRHVHFHIIPRTESVPESGRGPAIFSLPPAAPEERCAAIALAVADRLREHRDTAV